MSVLVKHRGKPISLTARLGVATRLLAGVFGGYGLTALSVMVLARALPLSRLEATEAATLASFAIYLAILIAAFAVRRVSALLFGMTAAGIVLAAVWVVLPGTP